MENYNEEAEIAKAIDDILMDRIKNPQQITGNKRYAIWLYSKARKRYDWLNHYPTEKLARDTIYKYNLEHKNVILRLEEYSKLFDSWEYSQPIELD